MVKEKNDNPKAKLPRILTFLAEAILSLEGTKYEGLFRFTLIYLFYSFLNVVGVLSLR